MNSRLKRFLEHPISTVRARIRYHFHPRSVVWQYLQRFKPQQVVIVELRSGEKLRIHPFDVIGRPIFVDRVFEREEIAFMDALLLRGMTVFDIGANIGQHTVVAARRVGSDGQVHAFEPSARVFSELQRNVELNSSQKQCKLNNLGLSEHSGRATLSVSEPGAEVFGHLSESTGGEDIELSTLDIYCQSHELEHIDFLKIDVEGAEMLVFRGGQSILRKSSPVLLFEYCGRYAQRFGYDGRELWAFLQELGYRWLYQLRGDALEMLEQPSTEPALSINYVASAVPLPRRFSSDV